MSESVTLYATRWPVALALACGVFLVPASGAIAAGSADVPAASTAPVAPGASAALRQFAVAGPAKIIDGDTLDVAGQRVRLEGIDAPEAGQTCARRLIGTWNCGAASSKALASLIDGRDVQCESHGRDKYGRMLGICYVAGLDLNERMVRDGYAWAFVKYSARYAATEQVARAEKRGIFSTENEPAWAYRAGHWKQAEQAAPEGCAIKGNVTRNGQIYHMPWSPWYGRVQVDPARGERWFCSESEAVAAGWRAAHGS